MHIFFVAWRDGIPNDRSGDGNIALYRVGAEGKRGRLRLYNLAIVTDTYPAVGLRCACPASGVGRRAVAITLRPWVADEGPASHGLRICGGQRAGGNQCKVLQGPERRAPSRELVTPDERSGLRCRASPHVE